MSGSSCDRDSELRTALRAGALPEDLRLHVGSCAGCQMTQRAAHLLLAYAETVTAQAEPPAAAQVWQRAQQRRQEAALRGAARGMLIMRVLAAMYLMGALLWALRMMWQTRPEQARHSLLVALTSGTVPVGMGVGLVLLVVGASSLMFAGQRRGPLPR